ncbi:hypothetical protein [Caballeronia sp. NK8]|uniref:hypothetical protein n=1 Tax=Caballeronia sp. NK8 TaxID=140098 RepID=UPI001BCB245E|nr:hypothetical protein [Caballeronia sp. NK8]
MVLKYSRYQASTRLMTRLIDAGDPLDERAQRGEVIARVRGAGCDDLRFGWPWAAASFLFDGRPFRQNVGAYPNSPIKPNGDHTNYHH